MKAKVKNNKNIKSNLTKQEINEQIQAVLEGGPNDALPSKLHSRILLEIDIELDNFYEHHIYWLNDIRSFCKWLIDNKTGLEAQLTLAELLVKATKKTSKKLLRELLQLLFIDRRLISLQYIYYSAHAKDAAFIDRLIWYGFMPYLDAKEIYGEELIDIAKPQSESPSFYAGYEKWGSFLEQNYNLDWDQDNYAPFDDEEEEDYDNLRDLIHSRFWNEPGEKDEDADKNEAIEKDAQNVTSYWWTDTRGLMFEMPECMRMAFQQIARKPADFYLQPVEIPANYKIYNAEPAVFEDLPRILAYMKQGKIKYTKDNSLAIGSLRTAGRKLNLHSSVGDWGGYIKMLLLASHLDRSDFHPTMPVLEIIDKILRIPESDDHLMVVTLFPIKNLRKLYTIEFARGILQETFDLLKLFPEGKWIELNQLIRYLEMHELLENYYPLEHSYMFWQLELSENHPMHDTFLNCDLDIRLKYVTTAFISGVMMTASALGLLDLAIDIDDFNIFSAHNNETNPWTSFTACRLTPLGAYFFKANKTYTPPLSATDNIRFELLPDRLQIRIAGNPELGNQLLNDWATKAGLAQDLLEFDELKVMARCSTQVALLRELKNFEKILGQSLPDYWKAEFMKLIQKSENIQQVSESVVYKLSPSDSKLHNLIAQDPELRKYCLKAEQFMLIVMTSDDQAFRRRLAQLGYFPLDNSSKNGTSFHFETEKQTLLELAKGYTEKLNKI